VEGSKKLTDIAASTATTASISVGGIVSDVLETPGDHDWFKITLTAGQSVTISLSGSGANPVTDTYLNLRNAFGTIIAHNDDSGGTLNSKIVFTPTTSGVYYIDAGAWDVTSQPTPATSNTITGTYTLSVQPYSPPPVWSDDQIANQLVNGYWNAQGGQTAHHFNVTQGGTITVNYSTLSVAEQTLAIAALNEWSDIIGVTFRPVVSGGQIVFDHSEDSSGQPTAATDGTWSNGIISSEHVQISSSWVNNYGTGLNSYSFQTYLHEIGHALGLGHAGNYNMTADYAADALFANDSWGTSIMSYFSESDNSYFSQQGFTEQFSLTPMVGDIIAVGQLYGLSTMTRTGDTTYGFNSNAGRDVYDANIIPNAAYTVFDSGGNDTLDYSGFSNNQLINLNAETFSNVGSGVGNVSIARGTVIENAIGGGGNDQLIGNDVANKLIGNGGNDTLLGGGGDDFLTGGSGTDTLTGGAGNDTFSDTMFSLYGDTITDFSAGDRIVFTDASLSTFTFNLSGTTLTYNGFTLNLGSAPATGFVASAAASGGVQLTARHAVANDFNGDGRSDVLWVNDDNRVTDWLGTASGSFADNGPNFLRSVTSGWSVAGAGDFNGDGKVDLLWQNLSEGRVTDWYGAANGNFSDNSANFLRDVGPGWQVAGTGDFNGDGRTDILWKNSDGHVTDWLGTSSGFTDNVANAYRLVASGWQVAGIADFNGDGRDDILWRNTDGRITEWLGASNGGFVDNDANVYRAVDLQWQVVGTADFNGDGRADILWRSSDGRVADWLGTASGGFTDNVANSLRTAGASWQVAEIGDFNGDGRSDILWRNSDGHVTDWLGTAAGGFTDNSQNAYFGTDTHWHVPAQIDGIA
jgi:hypothetical protein